MACIVLRGAIMQTILTIWLALNVVFVVFIVAATRRGEKNG
jgi:hypothetical protein